jgi:hypothetical protein
MPRMIDGRRLDEPNLAHDLEPHVQGLAGVDPLMKRQRRPDFITDNSLGHR